MCVLPDEEAKLSLLPLTDVVKVSRREPLGQVGGEDEAGEEGEGSVPVVGSDRGIRTAPRCAHVELREVAVGLSEPLGPLGPSATSPTPARRPPPKTFKFLPSQATSL